MLIPANNLVKLLSLRPFDHLNDMTSNRATIGPAIVTYFFEVTIFEPLLNKEMYKARSHRSQTQVSEKRLSLLSEASDVNVKTNRLKRRSPNLSLIETTAPSKVYQTFCGSLSFESANLSGVGQEILPVVSLEFDFLGSNYAVNDAAFDWQPKVVFLNGNFLGLSFMSKDFSFVEGCSDREESYFIYDLDRGSGAGDVNYYLLLPEVPTTASCFN